MEGATNNKALVNLATGMEDGERVLVAFLVATAALSQGKQVVIWATKEAVRLGLPGEAAGVVCKGCPPLERLFAQFADGGGELWLCPICVEARDCQRSREIPTLDHGNSPPSRGSARRAGARSRVGLVVLSSRLG
jgi:predicted peroxiredoxin